MSELVWTKHGSLSLEQGYRYIESDTAEPGDTLLHPTGARGTVLYVVTDLAEIEAELAARGQPPLTPSERRQRYARVAFD